MSKGKKILIIIILIAIVVLLFVIAINVLGSRQNSNSDYVKVTNNGLKKEQCINDICISNVYIICTKIGGTIHFTVKNNSKKTKSGYLKINFDDYNTFIVYSKVEPGKTKNGFTTYHNHDLTKTNDYSISELTNDDLSRIVK